MAYRMTPARRAALRKAQAASARKRRHHPSRAILTKNRITQKEWNANLAHNKKVRQPLKHRILSKLQGKNSHSRRATLVAEKAAAFGRKRKR